MMTMMRKRMVVFLLSALVPVLALVLFLSLALVLFLPLALVPVLVLVLFLALALTLSLALAPVRGLDGRGVLNDNPR